MSIWSKWSSLWPGWRLDVLHKSKKWSDSLKRHEIVRESVHRRIWKPAPSNIVLEQLMIESQGEWMNINREEFGLWSLIRQPVVSVQFAHVLGRVVNVRKWGWSFITCGRGGGGAVLQHWAGILKPTLQSLWGFLTQSNSGQKRSPPLPFLRRYTENVECGECVHASHILANASAHLFHPSLPFLVLRSKQSICTKCIVGRDRLMGTVDERTSIRWLGGFGRLLPRGDFEIWAPQWLEMR